jgi:Asp-tRNA(Asn)/Glu-tRNA(Gln) amidotransferase B subunit
VRPWSNVLARKLKRKTWDEGEYDEIFNLFPVHITKFIEVCQLDREDYDIDRMVEDLLAGQELPTERYRLVSVVSDELLSSVLEQNAGKVTEYFGGKSGVLNMFLGEYLRKTTDKSIDKIKLRSAIVDRLETIRIQNQLK